MTAIADTPSIHGSLERKKKKLVISAVNLVEGGPLTVLREAVRAAADGFPDWEIVVAVNRIGLSGESRVKEIAFPAAKTSWLKRLWLEWFGFYWLSIDWKPDVWISLHDITPLVTTKRQYVYCHHPTPFCTAEIPLAHLDRKFQLFRQFYGVLYGCFIKRNAAVIVQQSWLRDEFKRRYRVSNVIVAHPDVRPPGDVARSNLLRNVRFLYPAFPRVFKNHNILGEAVEILEAEPRWKGLINLTFDGTENAYAKAIAARFGHLRSLRLLGLQSTQQMEALYSEADVVIFPSLLETWGLPLTEAKAHGKPILAADLPYARETVGSYGRVRFFDATDAKSLAELILNLHLGRADFEAAQWPIPSAPYADGWKSLLDMLLVDDVQATPRK